MRTPRTRWSWRRRGLAAPIVVASSLCIAAAGVALDGRGASRVLGSLVAAVRAQTAASPQRPLASMTPAGAVLVLQAQDLGARLRDWNESAERTRWLASANYQTFERSRLFLRLNDAWEQFGEAAGFTPDMAALESAAGRESLLAIYDIGDLGLLYITRLPAARALESVLWREHDDFEPRRAGASTFYVRRDPKSRRIVSFAVSGDYLILGTRDDLVAGALTLLRGGAARAVASEAWYDAASRAAGPAADVRLVMNLAELVRRPQFRSYWIHRNVDDVRRYTAAVADLTLERDEIREERVLVRASSDPTLAPSAASPQAGSSDPSAIGQLLAMTPTTAGAYRVWASPTPADVVQQIDRGLFSPSRATAPPSRFAPAAPTDNGGVGGEGDLETRIDEAPPAASALGMFARAPLTGVVERMGVTAILRVQTTRTAADEAYVGVHTGFVVAASTSWNLDETRAAVTAGVSPLWTTSGRGVQWIETGAVSGSVRGGYHALDGLGAVQIAGRGRLLVIADDPTLLASMLERVDASAATSIAGIRYAAGVNLAQERAPFQKMMRPLDFVTLGAPDAGDAGGRTPNFFSENLVSLLDVLDRVASASIAVRDDGALERQTVIYRLR